VQTLCRGRVNNEPCADRRVLPLGLGNLPECRSQACAARRAPVGWRRGVAAQGGGDVAVSMDVQDADGEVAKAGYGPGASSAKVSRMWCSASTPQRPRP
jgi:hypothetical protein